jgi:hypothetical protein
MVIEKHPVPYPYTNDKYVQMRTQTMDVRTPSGRLLGTTNPEPVGFSVTVPVSEENNLLAQNRFDLFTDLFGCIQLGQEYCSSTTAGEFGDIIKQPLNELVAHHPLSITARLETNLQVQFTIDASLLYGNTFHEIAPALCANKPERLALWTQIRLLDKQAKGEEWDRRFALREPHLAREHADKAIRAYGDRVLTSLSGLAKGIDTALFGPFAEVTTNGYYVRAVNSTQNLCRRDYDLLRENPSLTPIALRERLSLEGLDELLGSHGRALEYKAIN